MPVNVTSAVERILGSERRRIVRTKLWASSLMESRADAADVLFAGTPDGGFIWPDFLPAYDAAVTLVKLLDLLARSTGRCPQVVGGAADRPRRPRDDRHAVGAQGHGDARDRRARRAARVVLVDGVKIIDADRWALVLPDPEEALTHVWAEAGSDVDARRLAQEYVERIRQMLV